MRKNGAEIVPVYSGSQTLVDAVSECMRYWVSNCDNTHMCVGSTVGPNIFVKICGWSTAQISRELKVQLKSEFKKIPNKIKLINCVGGGSSAYGFWSEFIDYNIRQIELIGVEAGGPKKSKLHAAPSESKMLKLEFYMERHLIFVKIVKDKLMIQNLLVLD